MNEAGFLLEEGNSIESLDKAMVDFGMPMGPMALLDEVGIDVAAKVAGILSEAFGARMEKSSVVEKLYADGRHGKKNGKGLVPLQRRQAARARSERLQDPRHPLRSRPIRKRWSSAWSSR